MPIWIKYKDNIYGERFSVIINIVIIVATIALAICTYLLFSTSQESLENSQDSLDFAKESLKHSQESLALMEKSLVLTEKSVKQQADYYEATTRPFVNIVGGSINYKKTNSSPNIYLYIEYILENYGNTPAKDVQSSSKYLAYDDSTYKRDFVPGEVIHSLYPNMTLKFHKNRLPIIFNDKNESFLHIAIHYKDMSGKTYDSLSIFFFWINSEGNLVYQHVKSYF